MKVYIEYFPIRHILALLAKLGIDTKRIYYKEIHRVKRNFISEYIPNTLQEIDHISDKWHTIASDAPIFVMWWQGFNALPPVVELCLKQLKKNNGCHPIVCLSKDNISEQYVRYTHQEINPQWLKWLNDGKISVQHFSDLIRTSILSSCGGIWIDATVFLTKPIDSIILSTEFYSCTRDQSNEIPYFPAEGKWASFFVASGKNNPIMSFIHHGLTEIIQRRGYVPEYLTMDYLFYILYRKSECVRKVIDRTPVINSTLGVFHNSDATLSKIDMDKYFSSTPLFKLNWRNKGLTTSTDNQPTIFSYLLHRAGK